MGTRVRTPGAVAGTLTAETGSGGTKSAGKPDGPVAVAPPPRRDGRGVLTFLSRSVSVSGDGGDRRRRRTRIGRSDVRVPPSTPLAAAPTGDRKPSSELDLP